jgi:signal transduction histidine kinase
MFQSIFNWRTTLALIAIGIVTSTIFYSRYVARKIAREERNRVRAFGEALKMKAGSDDPNVLAFTNQIAVENDDIPIIETDEKNRPTGLYINLDSQKVARDTNYLKKMIQHFAKINPPVQVEITKDPPTYNKYYYGESTLQNEVRYYPLVQLIIVGLFIIITLLALRSSYRSSQNQVWAGMAKETAHQLGTPVSSLEGWIEMLKQNNGNDRIVQELEKDVGRLQLITDRFGKIGSTPQLEAKDIIGQVSAMVEYMKKRAAGKVSFTINTLGKKEMITAISGPLFDWVIENLLKNALDAMEGKGNIEITIQEQPGQVFIDIADTGKGIARPYHKKVFKPGFTTKKRGWGLGLSLSKRIIEEYHKGEIFIKNSEPGKGTTFRIVLKK